MTYRRDWHARRVEKLHRQTLEPMPFVDKTADYMAHARRRADRINFATWSLLVFGLPLALLALVWKGCK